ncbi:MAG: hypothetical protein JKY56_19965, partial [Kofleriaceae bacterium]|nr:hypothetical protein [Kofleriaceae bacterium]
MGILGNMDRLSGASIIAIAMASTTLGCGEVEVPAGTSDAATGTPDAATGTPDAEPPCPLGAICGPDQNIAFVTSMPVFPGSLGGLSGGDDLCNSRADAAGLPGTYIAWLSDSTTDAATRIIEANASGWVRPDGRPFALSRARLLTGQLLYPLSLDENGNEALVNVVSGTSMEGTRTTDTCGDWTSETEQGESGRSDFVSRAWTSFGAFPCTSPAHIYCLGVDFDSPLTLP